jgi:hypothetical protein
MLMRDSPNESGRATWTRPAFGSQQDGAPGTAQHVSTTHSRMSDVRYIVRVHGIVHAAVADLHTRAGDAHDTPLTPL